MPHPRKLPVYAYRRRFDPKWLLAGLALAATLYAAYVGVRDRMPWDWQPLGRRFTVERR